MDEALRQPGYSKKLSVAVRSEAVSESCGAPCAEVSACWGVLDIRVALALDAGAHHRERVIFGR